MGTVTNSNGVVSFDIAKAAGTVDSRVSARISFANFPAQVWGQAGREGAMNESGDRIRAIRKRHYALTGRQLQLCGGCYLGYTPQEVGQRLYLAYGTVRRELSDLQHAIFDVTGLRPSRDLLRLWISEHRACCTAGCDDSI